MGSCVPDPRVLAWEHQEWPRSHPLIVIRNMSFEDNEQWRSVHNGVLTAPGA